MKTFQLEENGVVNSFIQNPELKIFNIFPYFLMYFLIEVFWNKLHISWYFIPKCFMYICKHFLHITVLSLSQLKINYYF